LLWVIHCWRIPILYLCRPVQELWHYSTPRTFADFGQWYVTRAGLNIGTAIIILLLPIRILLPMRVGLGQKLTVMMVLMGGGL
jgi:hypothetical protein